MEERVIERSHEYEDNVFFILEFMTCHRIIHYIRKVDACINGSIRSV